MRVSLILLEKGNDERLGEYWFFGDRGKYLLVVDEGPITRKVFDDGRRVFYIKKEFGEEAESVYLADRQGSWSHPKTTEEYLARRQDDEPGSRWKPEQGRFEPPRKYEPGKEAERGADEAAACAIDDVFRRYEDLEGEAPPYVRFFERLRRKHSQAR